MALIKQELNEHIELTRQEDGCLIFDVIQDADNLNKFTVYEEFINQQAFELHQVRVNKSKWGSVSKNVERHYEITIIS